MFMVAGCSLCHHANGIEGAPPGNSFKLTFPAVSRETPVPLVLRVLPVLPVVWALLVPMVLRATSVLTGSKVLLMLMVLMEVTAAVVARAFLCKQHQGHSMWQQCLGFSCPDSDKGPFVEKQDE